MTGVRVFASATAAALLLMGIAAGGGSAAVRAGGSAAVGSYIVVLKDGTDSSAVAARHGKRYGADVSFVYKHAVKGYAARLTASAVAAVQTDPDVQFVSEDRNVTAAAIGDCSDLTQCQRVSIGVSRINGDKSSTQSGDGSGTVPINVAVLDTGIDTSHADLNVVGGVDCTSGRGIDDPNGHGTVVAGLIGARDNGFGRVGVAPDARLWAVRVLKAKGDASDSEVICGIDWVTSTKTDSDRSNDIAIANMSLGGPGDDDGNCGQTRHNAFHLAICRSIAAGVTYVVSAMNDSADVANVEPAGYDEVLTATALADYDGLQGGLASPTCAPLGADDSAATFTNFATLPEDQAHTVAAPGVCLGSTYPPSTYAIEFGGTSFASPLVAGTVALCIHSGPCAALTPAQIVRKIVADAAAYNTKRKNAGYGFQGDPLRPIGGRYYGYLIDAGIY